MKRSLLLIAGLVIAFSARCDVHAVPADASKNQMVLTTSESVNLYYNTDDVNIVSFDAINGICLRVTHSQYKAKAPVKEPLLLISSFRPFPAVGQ